MRNLLSRALLVAVFAVGAKGTALAAESTRVASSFEDHDRFDIHFGVGYTYAFKQASILREWNGGGRSDTETLLAKDLVYRQNRHTLTPTVEIGLWHDLAVYAELPIIVSDTRQYEFDQRSDDCVYGEDVAGGTANATCVNASNSTTIRDEILPLGGIDANRGDPFERFTDPGLPLIFRAPVRRGLDQINVGLKYGILNENKRPKLPTWVLAFEGRFAVGRAMTFSRDLVDQEPKGNTRVGRRIHELGLWTSISRRHRFLDPFFTAYWRQALRASGSKFQDFTDFGSQGTILPQSIAGATIGTEFIPFERKAKDLKVAISVSGSAAFHYGGRGYSEVWELLADSPALVGSYDPRTQQLDAQNQPIDSAYCDRNASLAAARNDPGNPDYLEAGGSSCERYEGITDIENYASFGVDAGVRLHLSKYVRVFAGANVEGDTTHFVTNTDRGDADRGSGGADPSLVEPGTREVNPLRRDVVDNVGRRYAVDDVLTVNAYLRVLITF